MIYIKKEKDNKMYDSSIKSYINLDDILVYIESDIKFKIIDKDKKDITIQTLFSLIYFKQQKFNWGLEEMFSFILMGRINLNSKD